MALRITYEGDFEDASRLMDRAKHELFRLESRLETTGLDSGKFLVGFPYSNGYAYGYILPGGLKHIHVITSPGVGPRYDFEVTDIAFPDFLSGYALDGRYEADPDTGREAIRDFVPTAACVALHGDEVSSGHNRVERLAIDVGPGFGDYFPDRGPLPRSQVDKLYPSAYSGTMKKWVQIMLGFGKKADQTSVYDDVEPEIEPPEVEEKLTAWENTLVTDGMRVWYDFRFQRTHGIHWAQDGKPWLVEISMNRGVVAMPLPIDARTTTEEFRQKLENAGDQAGIDVIDEFGGFPTGEPFPSTAALWDAYERAGRIIELRPPSGVSEFYSYLHYSSAMGWAFNERGDEAHNTAYNYGDDGVQVGVHYAAQLVIGASPDIDPPDEAAELKIELDAMRADATRKATFEAVMWKIDRFNKVQCDAYLLRLNDEKVTDIYDEIDGLQLSGLASGSCSVTKAGEGKIWWPSVFQPQIKFYEPQLGYLLSHDMRPDRVDAPRDPHCDTTMHVFFAGNELKWAKYFYDPRTVAEGWYGDSLFEFQNTPVGNKYREYRRGPTGVPAGFYTNDVDPREEQPESVDEYYMSGEDRGYYLWIFAVDHWTVPFAPNYGNGDLNYVRHKKFLKEFDSYFEKSRRRAGAIVVPAWFRECMLVADKWQEHQRSSSHGWGWQGVQDPHSGFEAVGDNDGKVDELLYSMFPSELYEYTKDYADEGIWLAIGDEVVFKGDANSVLGENAGDQWFGPESDIANLTVTMIANSDHSPKVIINRNYSGYSAAVLTTLWFLPSPYPETGDTQYYDATRNCAGDSSALIYMDDINASTRTTIGSPQDSAFETRLPVFVGVV